MKVLFLRHMYMWLQTLLATILTILSYVLWNQGNAIFFGDIKKGRIAWTHPTCTQPKQYASFAEKVEVRSLYSTFCAPKLWHT